MKNTYGACEFRCPACSKLGRLFGELLIEADGNPDYKARPSGEPEPFPGKYHHLITFMPRSFSCDACKLELRNQRELTERGVDDAPFDVHQDQILGEFDPTKYLGDMPQRLGRIPQIW